MRRLVLFFALLLAAGRQAQAQAQAQGTANPHGPIRDACASCHRSGSWKDVRISPEFRHAERTFPLEGAHARVACLTCHKSLDFAKTPTTCATCHSDVHKGELGSECARCHTTRSFIDRASMQQAHSQTRFPLRGAHATVRCEACHAVTSAGPGQFVNKPTTCAGCHLKDFRATTSPSHEGARFSQDCVACHTIATWAGAKFDHSRTLFPLTGRHLGSTCAACHADKVFAGKSTTCVACHQKDFDASVTPRHRDGFPRDCTACHTTQAWKGAKFDHGTTPFALTGAHRATLCSACHGDLVFKGKVTTCVGCHRPDFDRTRNPSHVAAAFTTTCTACHTTVAYKGATYDHTQTRFPLTGRHVAATCEQCHADNVYRGKAMECVACHQQAFTASARPPHAALAFASTCQSCHTTAAWQGGTFDHSKTRFLLTGGHLAGTCASCHSDGVYRGKSVQCASCHLVDFNATKTPPHVTSGFPTDCAACHTGTVTWLGAVFDHAKTRFPLTGGHVTATCNGCHGDGVFRGKAMQCASCHQAAYAATTNPHHLQAAFSSTCETCHTTAKWKGVPFNHSVTRFPLNGAHVARMCLDCHGDKVYRNKPTACVSCHQAKYSATTNPNHVANAFPTTCEGCHNTVAWKGAFNHATTRFPLTGGHLAATCNDCHADGVYKGRSMVCASCHQADFTATANPHHAQAGFIATCETCHTTTRWPGAPYNHNATGFPLTGAHVSAVCADCHADKVYKGKPTTCVSCHLTKYNSTTNPKHSTVGYGTDCATCHTATQWPGANFDHSTTAFPLTGKHVTATCLACHVNGVFKGTPTTCASCHQTVYNTSTNPHHIQAGFATTCQTCHTTTKWTGAPFNHAATSFPLTGAHVATLCLDCHADKVYNNKSTTCVSCHQTDYNNTTNPKHSTTGYGTDCTSCHTTTQWLGATFDHSKSAFPLTGKHVTTSCTGCHVNGVYKGTPTTCASCHQTVYNTSTNPHHIQAGFATTCQTCHSTTTWIGAPYNHNATSFPLTGKHITALCLDCHADKVYNNKPTTCVSCHLTDYNSTTNPKHSTTGYGTDCAACHSSTTTWLGAVFDHTKTAFPLTGAHLAAICTDCHKNGVYKGTPTTCVSCHQTDFNNSTNPHHIQALFATTCQTCHTTTVWKGAPYNHNATAFPLTGKHLAAMCIDCHASKVYKGLPSTCVSCHLTDYNNTTNPKHSTVGYGTDCASCHSSTTTWLGAVFNHDGPYFRIYSGAHQGKWTSCTECHVNPTNYKVFECILCHQHSNKTKVDADHVGKPGYQYKSTACYSCHARV